MTSAFKQVKVDADCLSRECEKQGCKIGLTDVPQPFHLIDMDRDPLARGSRCDYLLVGEDCQQDLYVVPMELKSSAFRPPSVAKQLAGGAKVAHRRVPKVRCRFVPVVAHDGAHRKQINDLAKCAVHFRGTPYAIKTMNCGEEVAKHLK